MSYDKKYLLLNNWKEDKQRDIILFKTGTYLLNRHESCDLEFSHRDDFLIKNSSA